MTREMLIPSLAIVWLAREQSLYVLGYVHVFVNCLRTMCVRQIHLRQICYVKYAMSNPLHRIHLRQIRYVESAA